MLTKVESINIYQQNNFCTLTENLWGRLIKKESVTLLSCLNTFFPKTHVSICFSNEPFLYIFPDATKLARRYRVSKIRKELHKVIVRNKIFYSLRVKLYVTLIWSLEITRLIKFLRNHWKQNFTCFFYFVSFCLVFVR